MNKAVIAIAVLLLVLGSGWYLMQGRTSNSAPETSSTGIVETVMEKEVVIEIKNFAFSPKTVTVKKGISVTWTNQDTVKHNIVSDTGSELVGDLLAQGESYSHVFDTPGTYAYHCVPHPNMKATVVVE